MPRPETCVIPTLYNACFTPRFENLRDRSAPKSQADVYKTLEELVPLQVNVQAVASREVRGRRICAMAGVFCFLFFPVKFFFLSDRIAPFCRNQSPLLPKTLKNRCGCVRKPGLIDEGIRNPTMLARGS